MLDDYLIAWGAAAGAKELLGMEDEMKSRSAFLISKEKGEEVDSFNIGA